MAENDSHYNGVTDTTVDQNNGQEAVAGSPGAAVPLPDFEARRPIRAMTAVHLHPAGTR